MARMQNRRLLRSAAAFALLTLSLELFGCIGVRGRRGTPEESGFLGDYSKLESREGYEAQLIYVNPEAAWSRYDSIQIDSVTLWVEEEEGRLKDEEGQMLADLLYSALHEGLGIYFNIIGRPGPDAIRLRAAITQATGANVPLRTISTYVPVGLVASMAGGLSADVAATVGAATVEVELLDSITRQRLAAAVDSRAGTKSLVSGRTFSKWGDVEAACRSWAERIAHALLREGVIPKPGAPTR